MVIKLLCPDVLDIEQEIKKHPLLNSKGEKIKKDHVLFIIHCIMQQRASKDDEQLRKIGKRDGFVPLHSKILESKIPKRYHACIEYLINAGIIECDGKYSPGNVSLGYRLTSPFRGNKFKQIEISDFVLCKKIAVDKPFNRKNKAFKDYPYLAEWFKTGKLEIDEQAALTWINDLETLELQEINARNLSPQKRLEEKDLLFEKSRNYKILASRIKEKDYFFHVDETGNRLHTNLTNLAKGLREFITYDGQPLVSIDIKNSQPYMSLPLLGKEFWQSKNLPGKPTLKRIYREKYEETGKDKKTNINTIKFGVSSKTLVQLDFQKQEFIKNVANGTFYEYLITAFEKEGLNLGNKSEEKRNKVKKMVLTLLFDDDNKFYNKQQNSASQIFKRVFPSIANVFLYLKKENYKDLAIILQRIESYLLLKNICGRISKERPFLPIFTIHDSIVTTVGNENYVQTVMKEELEKSIGKAPQFSVEYWQNQVMEIAEAA